MEERKNPSADINRFRTMFWNVGLIISLLFIISAFEWKFYQKPVVDIEKRSIDIIEIEDVPVTIDIPPKPKVSHPNIIEIQKDDDEKDDIEIDVDIEIRDDFDKDLDFMEEVPDDKKVSEYVDFAEIQPKPSDGYAAFYKFLSKNIKYPKAARNLGIQGKVFVQFIVDEEGNLKNLKVVKAIGGGCDEEALRVLSIAPKWDPGRQGGRRVQVRMIIPIHFRLN